MSPTGGGRGAPAEKPRRRAHKGQRKSRSALNPFFGRGRKKKEGVIARPNTRGGSKNKGRKKQNRQQKG